MGRQLNAHLEHAAFEAFFETEATTFKYKQGHCQVSSLGFGGSNGHAVFWAKKNIGAPPDDKEAVINRIKAMSAPAVTVIGDDPSEWEWDGPDLDSKTGEKYRIFMSSNDPKDAAIRWEKNGRCGRGRRGGCFLFHHRQLQQLGGGPNGTRRHPWPSHRHRLDAGEWHPRIPVPEGR